MEKIIWTKRTYSKKDFFANEWITYENNDENLPSIDLPLNLVNALKDKGYLISRIELAREILTEYHKTQLPEGLYIRLCELADKKDEQ